MYNLQDLDTYKGNWKQAAYYWWAYAMQMRKIYEDTMRRHTDELMEERYATPMGSTNEAGTGTTNESSGSCRGGDACSI
jgi:hypothetical protein